MRSDLRPKNDVNPYAALTASDPLAAFGRMGIGVWRDGNQIVMHQEAKLPPFCIRTGEPTARHLWVWATWVVPRGSFRIAPPKLVIPLASRWRIFAASCTKDFKGLAFAISLPTVILAILIQQAFGMPWETTEFWAVMVAIVVFIIAAGWACIAGELLECVRSEGQYHWLRGADKRFLDHLPEWKPYE